MTRINVPQDYVTVACPECGAAGNVFARQGGNQGRAGDPDAPFYCSACGETFGAAVVRNSSHPKGGGSPAKYEELDWEDVAGD